ncbi:endonuclease I family protein [Candidatus Izemoplasma sp. B36]|uniref:endonuclease I family protein n=1 Tax=Candidatus Izemoplasma sp. B36 TaxID=3242468 RepID=UPI003559058A
MKRLIVLSLIFIGSIALIACGDITTETSTSTTVQETTTEVTTEEITIIETTALPTTVAPTTTITTTTIPTTERVVYTGIELTDQSKTFYRLDESFDKSSIEITANLSDGTQEVIASELIQIVGFNSSSTGYKNFYLVFNSFFVETQVFILEDYAIALDMEYYETALNLTGNQLKLQLNHIINDGFIGLLYGDARDILQESDVDPNNSNNIILVYTGNSVSGTWDGGTTWNREHTWPQSRLGVYVDYVIDYPSKATDVHNLKPADPSENYERSNDYFNDYDGTDFYVPRDEVKGDVARILFYMSTMYFDLTLNNNEMTSSSEKTMGMLSMLLLWNEQDPVDDFERNRNNVIYSYQGNRNPFIDYPEFANMIWGNSN